MTAYDQFDSSIECKDCNANFSFQGSKNIRFCPYCGKLLTQPQYLEHMKNGTHKARGSPIET